MVWRSGRSTQKQTSVNSLPARDEHTGLHYWCTVPLERNEAYGELGSHCGCVA